jgi:hypothetical protein
MYFYLAFQSHRSSIFMDAPEFTLHIKRQLKSWVFVSGLMLLSEVLLPWLSTRFFFDQVDLVMVGLGGVVYYWRMR